MYNESAAIYDAVYGSRIDYVASATHLRQIIAVHKRTSGSALLDVACGTGTYLVHLRDDFAVEGLDVSPQMVEIARKKLPDNPIHETDMVNFNIGKRFDVILCLGSSIGYVRTLDRLSQTLHSFAHHIEPGGVLIVEPWIEPTVWEVGRVVTDVTDEPELKIARILVSGQRGHVSTLDIHHLVARGTQVDFYTENHELGLFTRHQHISAFQNAGFSVEHDPVGLIGRGLYIGTVDI